MLISRSVAGEMKKLIQHSSHYLVGLFGGLAIGFISFPIFTRVFSVADYGMIDFIQKILLVPTALSKAGMQNSVLRFYNEKEFSSDRESARSYYSTMLFGVAAMALVITLVFLVAVKFLLGRFIDGPLETLLLFASALILLRAIESILLSFLRIEERTAAYNAAQVLMKAAMVGTVCAFLPWLGRSVRTYLSGTMVAEAAFVAVLVAWLFRRRLLSAIKFDRALFRSAIGFGLPLIFYELAGVILLTADRALVRYYLGGEALGYYSVAYGLSQYVNDLMTVPLGLAILPIYLRLWSAEGRTRTIEFLHLSLDFYLMAAIGIYMLVTLGSHDALVLLASPKYLGADRLIPYLVGGLLIYTTHVFLCAGLLIQKKTGIMALALICSTALNIVLNCLLLPRMGLQGAAIALLLTHIVTILLLWLASSRILPIGVRGGALAKYAAAGLVAWAVASRIALASHLLNAVSRCAVGIAIYAVALIVLDSRARSLPAYLLRSRRSQSVEAGMAGEAVLSVAAEEREEVVCK
jgi:O-antigen/teichoic acid export membrane protein